MKTMLTAALLALLSCGPALAQFGGTSADTTQTPTNFRAWKLGAVKFDSLGLFSIGGNLGANGYTKGVIGGPLTSNGGSTVAVGLAVSPQITAAAGDISYLTHSYFGGFYSGNITTQSGEVINTAASIYASEPNIVITGGSSITNAATVYIHNPPTEGIDNYALLINSGDVELTNGDLRVASTNKVKFTNINNTAYINARTSTETVVANEETNGTIILKTEDDDAVTINDPWGAVAIQTDSKGGTATALAIQDSGGIQNTMLFQHYQSASPPFNVWRLANNFDLYFTDDAGATIWQVDESLGLFGVGENNGTVGLESTLPMTVSGLEGGPGGIALYADNGDDNADRWGIFTGTDGDLKFEHYGTGAWVNRFYMNQDGTFGVGGDPDANVALEINHPLTRANAKSFITAEDATDGTELFSITSDASGNARMDLRDASGNQDVQINTTGTSWINGNLAVGQTSASVMLDVAGQGDFSSSVTRTLSLDYTGTGGFVWQTFKRGGTEKWWISSDSADDDLDFQDQGGGMGPVLTLESGTGNIGIGDITPDGKLDVHDAALNTAVIFSSAGSEVHLKLDAGGTSDTKIGWDTDLIFYGSSSLSGALGAWLDSGDFGIGDETPDAFLDVYNSTDENVAALFEVAGSNARIHLKDGNTTSASTVGVGANGDSLHFLASGNIAGHATFTGGVGSLEATGWGEFGFGVSHMDDVDTYMFFNTDAVDMVVGGATLMRLVETGTDSVYIGEPDDVVAIKDSHMVFLANDNDVVINAVEVTGDIDALTETGQVLAITGGYPVLYFNDVTTSGGGDNDFTIQVNNDYMTIVDETAAGQAMLHMNGSSVVVHKGSGTIDHHLEVHNGAVYSELDAGEASFTTSSTPAMKQNILPLTPAQVQALRAAYLDSIQVYNYSWRQDALFSAADSAAMAADTVAIDLILNKEVAKIERQRATRIMGLDSVFVQDRQLVRFDTVGIDTLSLDTLIATRQDTTVTDGDTVLTTVQDTTIKAQTAARLDTVYADVVSLVRVDTTWAQVPGIVTPVERSLLRRGIKTDVQARQQEKAAQARQKAVAGASEMRVGFMAPEAKVISQIVAPGAARDGEFNSHHILMAQVALVQDLLQRVQDLENRIAVLESR